ncbi:lipoyl domain-containing protein [Niveispirillum sp.]|uniref:lipoyl domain-containing protein n=1 Tax=Niveispirillum sp. TaxID=1917217 RepID=UPI001B791D6F|nr:lipoyl domain-containing protein [Niveispirillum sp.]MBP7334849.1 lipoyl domain-containing protein [Niveispirillum sp.]
MTQTPILIPATLWDDDSPGVISTWLFDDGDTVSEGAVVAELMNEKVGFEITAPVSGTLIIEVAAETEVMRGQRIGAVAG